jgi:cytochrome P450 family 142 subfamily A polypeptide 1
MSAATRLDGAPPGRPDVDLADGRFYGGDPHPAFAWMREHAPVYRCERSGLVGVTRHADVMFVSKTPELFGNREGITPNSWPLPMMVSMDRPEHMLRRNLVNRGFTPRRVAEKEPWIRRVCGEILDAVAPREECDFVHDIAARLPLIVIGELLGVEREHLDDLLRWSDDTMSATGNPDPAALGRAAASFSEFADFNRRIVADRRAKPPGTDLMSILVHAEVDGARLDDESLLYESLLILNGGDETTRHVISGGVLELMRHPEQRAALVRDPAKIPTAVEEMLRFVSPIQSMMRTVRRDTELGGTALREGERLLMLYPSANRDAAVFEDADAFDVARDPNPHVAFGGYGPHFCLGNALARLELRVLFEELLRRFPEIELAGDEPLPRRQASFVTGFERMPVRLRPRA